MSHNRSFWQLHLSTAILIMFIAGVLLWMNSIERVTSVAPSHGVSVSGMTPALLELGWPFAIYRKDATIVSQTEDINQTTTTVITARNSPTPILLLNVCFNVLVSITLLLGTAFICESMIRRRHRRKL